MDLLKHLGFFVVLAETRHFGQAADELGMTQPPLSQGIQRLEGHLGVRLFDRNARGVRLTAAGRSLIPLATNALAAAERLRVAATEVAVETTPPLRVGVPLGEPALAVRVIAAATRASSVPVLPHVRSSMRLVEDVAVGDLDVAVVRHPLVTDGTLAGEVITVATHLLTTDATDARAPFAGLPREHHPPVHDQLVDALSRTGHIGSWLAVAGYEDVLSLVAAGSAVTLTVDPDPPGVLRARPLPAGVPPLRFRVLRHPLRQRPDVDLEEVGLCLAQGLS